MNIIYLCRDKLLGIDSILPILMELNHKITFVFMTKKQLVLVKKNYDLWEIIQSIKKNIIVIKGNKIFTALNLVIFVLRFTFQRNIVFKDGDPLPFHRFIMFILRKTSKTTVIKYHPVVKSLEGFRNARIQSYDLGVKQKNTYKDFFGGYYDHFLSIMGEDDFLNTYKIHAPKIIKTGYIRRLPKWTEYYEREVGKNRRDPYFLYILSYTGQRKKHFDEPDLIELVEESLEVFKKHKLRTVFRPHAITDMARFGKLLDKLNYKNYIIDHGHPMILSAKAQFVFGNIFSDTMFNAYYQGKPVVEYCQYDQRLLEAIGRKSYGGKCCDFFIQRDQDLLDKTISILSNVVIARDPFLLRGDFPETPLEFTKFLKEVL